MLVVSYLWYRCLSDLSDIVEILYLEKQLVMWRKRNKKEVTERYRISIISHIWHQSFWLVMSTYFYFTPFTVCTAVLEPKIVYF